MDVAMINAVGSVTLDIAYVITRMFIVIYGFKMIISIAAIIINVTNGKHDDQSTEDKR